VALEGTDRVGRAAAGQADQVALEGTDRVGRAAAGQAHQGLALEETGLVDRARPEGQAGDLDGPARRLGIDRLHPVEAAHTAVEGAARQ
jgi:hypothetical protein